MELPLLHSAHGLSALIAAEAQIPLVDFGRIEVGDKVILEGHALIEFFAKKERILREQEMYWNSFDHDRIARLQNL